MNRRIILKISLIFVIAIMVVFCLYTLAEKPIRYSRGFHRSFKPISIREKIVLKQGAYYVAGNIDDSIFLGIEERPLDLSIVERKLSRITTINLSMDDKAKSKYKNLAIEVRKPYCFIYDGTLPAIYKAKIGDWYAKKIMGPVPFFMQGVALSDNKIVVRAIGGKLMSAENKTIFGQLTGEPVSLKWIDILNSQGDDVFSAMGILRFDKMTNKLAYVHTYKNEYIIMDTNLSVAYRSNTIDTISKARIKQRKSMVGLL